MSVRNRIYSPVRYQLRSTDPYGVPIEARFDGEKEEGACGCGVFAAPAQTAEAEWSRLLPTWRRGWGSNPRAALLPHRRFQGDAVMTAPAPRLIGVPIEARFDGEKEEGDCGNRMEQASSDVVTPAGFEPGIAAVKGRCPIRLDERAMSAPVGAEYFYAITRI